MQDIRSLKAVAFSDIQQFTIKIGQNENIMMKMLHQHKEIFSFVVEKYNGRIHCCPRPVILNDNCIVGGG